MWTTAKKVRSSGFFTDFFLLLVFFLRPSRNLGQNALQLATTASFHVLPSYLLGLSQSSDAYVTDSVVKQAASKLQAIQVLYKLFIYNMTIRTSNVINNAVFAYS
jgi:hypothetical protein